MCPPKHINGSNCIHKQVVHGTNAVVLNQKLKWELIQCWIVMSYMVVLMQIPIEMYTMISHLLQLLHEGNTGRVKGHKLTINKVNEKTPNSHSFQQIYMTMFAITIYRFSHLLNVIGAI